MLAFAACFRIARVETRDGEPMFMFEGERGISGDTVFERLVPSIMAAAKLRASTLHLIPALISPHYQCFRISVVGPVTQSSMSPASTR